MAELTITKTTPNGHGEAVKGVTYGVTATIDKVTREAVTEGTNERRGYDLVCFVKPGDVPVGLDLMAEDFVIELDGLTYEPAKVEEQRGFGGTVEHFNLKARLA